MLNTRTKLHLCYWSFVLCYSFSWICKYIYTDSFGFFAYVLLKTAESKFNFFNILYNVPCYLHFKNTCQWIFLKTKVSISIVLKEKDTQNILNNGDTFLCKFINILAIHSTCICKFIIIFHIVYMLSFNYNVTCISKLFSYINKWFSFVFC